VTLDQLEWREPELLVERHRLRFRVHHYPEAAKISRQANRKIQNEAKQLPANPPPPKRVVHRQTGQPQNRKRVSRQPLPQGGGELLDLDVPRRHCGIAGDTIPFDRHVGSAEVMTKLVLPGVLVEKTIQVRVARAKSRPIVRFPERPNLHRRS